MSTRANAASLTQSAKDLSLAWQRTRESWNDAKSLEFDRHYLEPLPGYIGRALSVMDELDALLRKARTDCE